MANLQENTTYQNKGKVLSIADLSGLVKTLQEKAQTESKNNIESNVSSYFSPSRIFRRSEPTTQEALGDFPVGQTIGERGEGKYEDIPAYAKFVSPDERKLWVTPSDQAKTRNWPEYLGGGQYTVDVTQPGALIKSERSIMNERINPGAYKSVLGDRSPYLFEVDHNIPLWVGGSDTLANLQVLDKPTHRIKTSIQSVPLTLLANNKIDINQAKIMALAWKGKDTKGLPSYEKIDQAGGYVPLKTAEKIAKKWEDDMLRPKSRKFFGEAFKEEMKSFGEGWLPRPISAFAKGLVSGGTAGIVPYEPSEGDRGLETVTSTVGQIAGTITGLGLLSRGISAGFRGAKSLLGLNKVVSVANNAMRTVGLTTDIGSMSVAASKARNIRLKRIAGTAGLLGLWGQIGLTGQKATNQIDAEFGDHVERLLYDLAFGGILGASGQTLKGYATVGLGTASLSLMENGEIVPALQDAALMIALHGMGYKRGMKNPKLQFANEEAYKMSSKTFNDYLGNIIPTVKKGQGVPETLKLDIPKIEKMRIEYQEKYPRDQRLNKIKPITNNAKAIDFMEQAARRQLGNLIAKSEGTIPQEQIKKEMTRIIVAKNQLYNQTLAPKARKQKEWQDLQSMGESLKPQFKAEQLRTSTNTTKALENIPFNVPTDPIPNTNKIVFSQGEVPITGYGGKIDVLSKKTINDFYQNPEKFSNKAYVVKEAETASVMRYLEGEGYNVGNPDHALRVFLKEKTPDGFITRPAGYVPREQSFNTKANPLNELYFEVTSRLRHTIETSKSAPELRKALDKDKAAIQTSNEMISNLFARKGELSKMSDQELYSILNAKNAPKKYDSNLNNSTIAREMEKNGISVLVVDVGKVLPTGDAVPRYNPDNPYLTIKLSEQDALKSIAFKKSETRVSPIQQGIKDITSRQRTESVVKTIKDAQKFQVEQKKRQPPLSLPETAPKTPVRGSVRPIEAPKPPIRYFESTQVSKAPELALSAKSKVERLVAENKITQMEALTYKRKERRYNELMKKAENEILSYEEKNEISILSKELNTFLQEKGVIKKPVPQRKGFVNYEKIRSKNANYLLENALNQAEGEMALVRGKKSANDPDSYKAALSDAAKGAKSIIITNKLNLPKAEQRELMKTFDLRVKEMVQTNVNNAFEGTKDIIDREYSIKYEQYVGFDPATGKDTVIKDINKRLEYLKSKVSNEDLSRTEIADLNKQIKNTETTIEANEKRIKDMRETTDQKLARKYNLELKEDGYLKLDKQRNPMFNKEYQAKNPKQTPMGLYGEFLKKDLEINTQLKTIYSEQYVKDLEMMSKAPNVYSEFSSTVNKLLKKIIVEPQDPWLKNLMKDQPAKSFTFNSLMRPGSLYQKRMFQTINPRGHTISQPLERIIAEVEGATPKELAKIDVKTKEKEATAELARAERGIGKEGENILKEEIITERASPEDIKGMSLREDFQMEKVQDLTNFELRFPSFIYEQVTGKIPPREAVIGDAIKYIKDFLSNYNAGIKSGGKIKKIWINNAEWSKIKSEFINTKKDGTGGLYKGQGGQYDGQGGLFGDAWKGIKKGWEGFKDKFDGRVEYTAPKPTGYNIRGLKINDKDLSEASNILYGEVSNRSQDLQKKEIKHIMNTAINRAVNNPQGFGATLTEVLQKPKQYQSYAPKGVTIKGKNVESQYQKLLRGATNETDKKKFKLITDTINEIKSGSFTDTTGGKMFYVHASDGTLWLGSTVKEAKQNANLHEKSQKLRKTRYGTTSGLPVQ